MKKTTLLILISLFVATTLSAQNKEQIIVSIDRNENLPEKMERTQREMVRGSDSRGLVAMGLNLVTNLGTKALFQIIDKADERKAIEWTAPCSNDCFYRETSFLGPLDPTGLHFHGIRLERDEIGSDGSLQQAVYIKCSMPEEKLGDYITTRRFGLQIDTIAVDLSKVKAKYTRKKRISIQISIVIKASWMDDNMTIHKDQEMGQFNICLSSLKYDKNNPVVEYSAEEAKDLISGSCFFIPRSYGAIVSGDEYKQCWSKGEFEVYMIVKESTGGKTSETGKFIHDYFANELPSTLNKMATNEKLMGSSIVEIINNY